VKVEVVNVQSHVRPRWRLRLRYWLLRRRLGPAGRAIADAHDRALDEAMLFGRRQR
jgi:hypothetical protein